MTILLLTSSSRPSGLLEVAFLKILPSTRYPSPKPRPHFQCPPQQQLVKHYNLVAGNDRNVFSCRCGSCKAKVKVLAGRARSGGSREGLSCLFQLLVAPGFPGLVATSLQALSLSSRHRLCLEFLSTSLLEGRSSLDLGLPDNPGFFHLKVLNYISKNPFS